MNFYFRAWMRTLMTWVGIAGIIYGGVLLYTGAVSAYWLIGTFITYQICMFTLSVGNHRLFSHRAFKTNKFWQWFFSIWGTGFGNGSSYMWVFIHLGHHMFSDTERDPHETTFKYFFRLKHKQITYTLPKVKWLLREANHYYTHKYAVLFVLMFPILASLVSFNFFLFCYLIPMAWHQITGGLFYIYSHNKSGALNRFWIGIPFPFAGEWLHKSHHEAGKGRMLNNATEPGQFDIGYWFARLIATK